MTLVCSGGSCVGPSCAGLAADCGPSGSATCCATSLVPGGTYDRSNDASYPATVSDFKLDVYEVTVGRFRAFVSAGKGTQGTPPAAASGANPNLAGSGWQAAWNTSLVANTNALKAAIKCNATYQTWTDSPAGNEDRPMNCITWYEAFAFCIWDGGRLPTEAEWNYVAAGGDEQRLYPWGATAPDDTYAVYCGGSCASTQNVGAKSPKGDGKWGHADLAGNVNEWALDWSATPYPMPCSNCGVVTSGAARVQRGGSFQMNESVLPTSPRGCGDPTNRNQNLGARCARSP
jgi:formylglycine-generating enzyme required for sulfatase activity